MRWKVRRSTGEKLQAKIGLPRMQLALVQSSITTYGPLSTFRDNS